MPAVSVLMPVRNAAATVARAIASIRAQTLADWELVVVDDGSCDGTPAVLAELARDEPRLRVLTQSPVGIAEALNAGLEVSRSPLIARMDADDEAHPERLGTQVEALATDPALGLVGCLVDFGGDRAQQAGYALHIDWLNTIVTPAEVALNRFVESPFAHPSVCFRRELVGRHGGYREGDFPEDYELWLRWLDAGVRMAKIPRRLLTWHDSLDRLSRTDARYDAEAFFRVKASYLAREVTRIRGDRSVFIWGAGRPTRKRAAHLAACGVTIVGYIDIDPKKTGRKVEGVPVLAPDEIPPREQACVLGYVASRGARDLIRAALLARSYREGHDFLMCA